MDRVNEDVEERWVEVVQEMKVCRKDQVVWIRRIVPWLVARVVGDWKPSGRPRACLLSRNVHQSQSIWPGTWPL